MPQKHSHVHSVANRRISVVSACELVPKQRTKIFSIINVAASDASSPTDSGSPKALRPAPTRSRNSGNIHSDSAEVGSRTTTSARPRPMVYPVEGKNMRKSANSEGNSGAVNHNAPLQEPLPDCPNKQKGFSSQPEYVNTLPESIKGQGSQQIDTASSQGQANHPDLEQPPREHSRISRHTDTSPSASRTRPARSTTPEARHFSKSWPIVIHQSHAADLGHRSETSDDTVDETHKPAENGSSWNTHTRFPISQSHHGTILRHANHVVARPDLFDTHFHKPPLIKTDRHHTERGTRAPALEQTSASAPVAKQGLRLEATAPYRYGDCCMDPPGGDDDDDDDDDDGQIGFRNSQRRSRHFPSAPNAGHDIRARDPKYNRATRFPHAQRLQPRRRHSYSGVS